MKLSIIVPVYNVEKYIVKCVKSLLHQNFDDYEIIVIDDGTPDKSMEVLQEAVCDNRITIIHQSNAGLSAARNTGMMHSKGEYLWFVDSDDWIAEDCLSNIAGCLTGCDILYFSSHYNASKHKITVVEQNYEETNGRQLSKKDLSYPVQYYIYRRAFLEENNLRFEVGRLHEDTLFTPIALYLAHDVTPFKQPVYYQYARSGSITHTVSPKRCYDLMAVTDSLIRFASSEVKYEDRYEWGNCIADCFNEILLLSLHYDDVTLNDIHDYITTHKEDLEYLCKSRKFPSRVLGYLLKQFRLPPIKTYRVLYKLKY